MSDTETGLECRAHPLPPAGRILALDVGTRRTGVAVSDPLRITVRPLTTLELADGPSGPFGALARTVAELVETHQASALVVGYPRLPSGDRGEQAEQVEAFLTLLVPAVPVPVFLWDESFTTLAAHERMSDPAVRKAGLDAAAAAVILEEWLREHTDGSEPEAIRASGRDG